MSTAIKFPNTPGVKIQEISKFPPSVAAVATAIPAFIGHTENTERNGETLINVPTYITSMLEYETLFGGPQLETKIEWKVVDNSVTIGFAQNESPSFHRMYYALQAFFANGGGPCYVVSVGKYDNSTRKPDKEKLKAGLTAVASEDEPTLIVFPEAQGGLTIDDHAEVTKAALTQCLDLKDRFVITDLHHDGVGLSSGDLKTQVGDFRTKFASSDKAASRYGAAYFPNLKTTLQYAYNDEDVTESGGTKKLSELESTDGALYSKIKLALSAFPVILPPSSSIAGVYARVDANRGVWKAPANEGVTNVIDLTHKVNDQSQEDLNVDATSGMSINAIRTFAGQGTLIWGARTLDGNSNEWRYVPVRRFFNMVEESTKKASARFVFEPNDKNTWVKVRAMIENFLLLQWREGALQGSKPEQAFYVRVGLGETMIPLDILEGRMNVEIGMAVVRPAEFIILKFSHKMPEA